MNCEQILLLQVSTPAVSSELSKRIFTTSEDREAEKRKEKIQWDDVEEYLKMYVGEVFEIADTEEVVYIGTDLPDEYTHSKYTVNLKGAAGKSKANAVQGIPELIEIATNREYEKNKKEKHNRNAKKGGIGMKVGLHYRYLELMEKWKDIMCFMQECY